MIAWLDASSGLAGDKLLGALLELGEARGGFGLGDVRSAIAALGLPEARIDAERVTRGGIAGTSVRVSAAFEPHHRTWRDIRASIERADLPPRAAALASDAFERLARAEARVHGVLDPDDVAFHEVGAIDSIVDVVGVALGIDALGIEGWTVGPIALGSGLTPETAHGRLPAPAPATLELLADAPGALVASGADECVGELTTPTGAALALAAASGFGAIPAMSPVAVGYGAGTREVDGMPNVLRIVLGEPTPGVTLLETNIDHLSAEECGFVAETLLLESDALDVWLTPIIMKKGRPALMLSALAEPTAAVALAKRIGELTGTLGVRREELARTCADRESREIETPWGPARVKIGAGRVRPEHDDVARIASAHSLPYRFVRDEIARLAGAE